MSEATHCAECGAELPPGLPKGLCPKCALSSALVAETVPLGPAGRPREQPGDRIGRYKLLQKIDEGGCGVVYMAEQEEPVHRRVALKVIKLGMDTKQVIARFEAERQALALMDHPNIAKVLDAGATETGRPYFVMELVRGVKITSYCDEAKLSTSDRLGLFIQVCQAIQHAHQKGIIHRDIKPSNILVTVNDGVPVPKVIDFGIAKATNGQRLTDKTLFTAFELFMGTPAYMSPEQAEMTSLDIDTRSDIYSLGVLLYELLTGHTPFDAKELVQAGVDEIRRKIREDEPPKPSTRLNTLLQADLSTISNQRDAEPATLINVVRGDIDWIVMKALEKDRMRRYDTASSFAADIVRHLESEPVVARPPSKFYRFQKLVRRHKLAFTSATWMLFRERAARQVAVEAQRNADLNASVIQSINEFLTSDLLGPSSENNMFDTNFKPPSGGPLIEGLERVAANIGDKFRDQPLVEAKLRLAIGDAYSAFNVSRHDLAIPHYERALALRRAASGTNDTSTLHSMRRLAHALKHSGQIKESMAMNSEALRLLAAKYGPKHDESIGFLMNLADDYERDGQSAEAMKWYEELVAQTQADPEVVSICITYMNKLATLYEKQNEFAKAEVLLTEAIRRQENKYGVSRSGGQHAGLGAFLLRRQRYEDAEKVLRKSLRLLEENQPGLWTTPNARSLFGASLLGQKKFADAEPDLLAGYSELKEREDEMPADRKDRIGMAIERLIELYTEWKRPTEVTKWKETLGAFQNSHPPK